jgi:hypothetical protein
MHVRTENLATGDKLTAVLLFISGCILYYRTYKLPEKKKYSYMGLALVFIATLIFVLPFIFTTD